MQLSTRLLDYKESYFPREDHKHKPALYCNIHALPQSSPSSKSENGIDDDGGADDNA